MLPDFDPVVPQLPRQDARLDRARKLQAAELKQDLHPPHHPRLAQRHDAQRLLVHAAAAVEQHEARVEVPLPEHVTDRQANAGGVEDRLRVEEARAATQYAAQVSG